MATGNGNRVKIAILATDLKYVKESQEQLELTVGRGFQEVHQKLDKIQEMQQSNANDLLAAKSSLKAVKWIFGALFALLGFMVTMYASFR